MSSSTILVNLKVAVGADSRLLTFYFTPPAEHITTNTTTATTTTATTTTTTAAGTATNKNEHTAFGMEKNDSVATAETVSAVASAAAGAAGATTSLLVSLSTMITRTFQSKLAGVEYLYLAWHDENGSPQPMLTDSDVLAAVHSYLGKQLHQMPAGGVTPTPTPVVTPGPVAGATNTSATASGDVSTPHNVTTALYNIIDNSLTPSSARGSTTSGYQHHNALRIEDNNSSKVLRLTVLNEPHSPISVNAGSLPSTPVTPQPTAPAPSPASLLLSKLFGSRLPPSLAPPPPLPLKQAVPAQTDESISKTPTAENESSTSGSSGGDTPPPPSEAATKAAAAQAAVNFFASAATAKMMGGKPTPPIATTTPVAPVPVLSLTDTKTSAPAAPAPAAAAAPAVKQTVWNRVTGGLTTIAGYIPFANRMSGWKQSTAAAAPAPVGVAPTAAGGAGAGVAPAGTTTPALPVPVVAAVATTHNPNLALNVPPPLSVSVGSLTDPSHQPPSVHSVSSSRESDESAIAAALAASAVAAAAAAAAGGAHHNDGNNMLHESFDEHKLKEDLRPSREELEWELDQFLHNIVLRFGFEADDEPHDADTDTTNSDEAVVFDASTAAAAAAASAASPASAAVAITASGGGDHKQSETAAAATTSTGTCTGRPAKWADLYRFSATRAAFAHDIGLVLDKYSSMRRVDRKSTSGGAGAPSAAAGAQPQLPQPVDPRSVGTAAGVSGATAS